MSDICPQCDKALGTPCNISTELFIGDDETGSGSSVRVTLCGDCAQKHIQGMIGLAAKQQQTRGKR